MAAPLSQKFEGKKFMWDGAFYETEDQAHQTRELYQKEGFEVQICLDTDKYLVYSRRIATVQTAE